MQYEQEEEETVQHVFLATMGLTVLILSLVVGLLACQCWQSRRQYNKAVLEQQIALQQTELSHNLSNSSIRSNLLRF